jgi:hypothetical protein
MVKTSIPKGTRDFSPAEVAKDNILFKLLKAILRNLVFNLKHLLLRIQKP